MNILNPHSIFLWIVTLIMVTACNNNLPSNIARCPSGKSKIKSVKHFKSVKKKKQITFSYGSSASIKVKTIVPEEEENGKKIDSTATIEPILVSNQKEEQTAKLPQGANERAANMSMFEVSMINDDSNNSGELFTDDSSLELMLKNHPEMLVKAGQSSILPTYNEPAKKSKNDDFIKFNNLIYFLPHYDIFLEPDEAHEKLQRFAEQLKSHPTFKTIIVSHISWPKEHFTTSDGKPQKIHFGNSDEVYNQEIWVKGSSDMERLQAENRQPVDAIVVGKLMDARGLAIKVKLINFGVPPEQLGLKRGELFKGSND